MRRLRQTEPVVILCESGLKKLDQTWYMTLLEDPTTDTETIRIGIDEVGRGCVYGPIVVAGCAILNGWRIKGIKDSKAIRDEKKRKALASEIQHNTVWCSASVSAEKLNLLFDTWKEGERPMTTALRLCFEAIEQNLVRRLRHHFPDRRIEVICDGDDWPDVDLATHSRRSIVKADATVYEVSAASILAKVLRDNWVHDAVKADATLSRYGLDGNKGYGTAEHTAALRRFGLTPHHRNKACATLLSE